MTQSIVDAIKETSIDCFIHSNGGENGKCFSLGTEQLNEEGYAYKPSYQAKDERDNNNVQNEKKIMWRAVKLKISKKEYALRLNADKSMTDRVYDLQSYLDSQKNPNIQPKEIGKLVEYEKNGKKKKKVVPL